MQQKYICVSVVAKKSISHKERKEYISKLYGDRFTHRIGLFHDFNARLGYDVIVDDHITQYPEYIPAKYNCPDYFDAPLYLLMANIWVDLSNKGIVKFVVLGGEEKCDEMPKFSYDRFEMCLNFAEYLSNTLTDCIVNVSYLDTFNPILRTRILNYFYLDIDPDSTVIDVNASAPRLLTDDEKAKIESKLAEMVPYKFKIEQYFCRTCKRHHPECPYHIEITYLDKYSNGKYVQ